MQEKHPGAQGLNPDAVISHEDARAIARPFHPVLYERLTGDQIRSAALRTEGAAGPSGLDASQWRRLCTAFKKSSAILCNAVAAFARRLATQYVDPAGLSAFVACRLVSLDKNPGVRPIGVCETVRRIIGKAIS